jgi:hypothetical protein
MVSLETAGLRFNSLMHRMDGLPFKGTIEPLDEGRVSSYDFSEPRFIMRVQPSSPIKTTDIILDHANRRFLVADHDTSFAYNVTEFRSHVLYPMNTQALWERQASVTDPLTNLKKGTGVQNLGQVWCLFDRIDREFIDSTVRVKEETRRVITAAAVQLGDILNKMVVKRVDPVRGVWLAEVQ